MSKFKVETIIFDPGYGSRSPDTPLIQVVSSKTEPKDYYLHRDTHRADTHYPISEEIALSFLRAETLEDDTNPDARYNLYLSLIAKREISSQVFRDYKK